RPRRAGPARSGSVRRTPRFGADRSFDRGCASKAPRRRCHLPRDRRHCSRPGGSRGGASFSRSEDREGPRRPRARPDRMEVLKPDARGLARAADLVKAGEVIAFPTDTVYGLAALASDHEALLKIFAIK